jgi:hypothetical protein
MPTQTERLVYGPNKYAALHLLLCRWARLFGIPGATYCYVTLGGTELKDVESLRFVDAKLASMIWSYENDGGRYKLAQKRIAELSESGVPVDLQLKNIFSHRRTSNLPHIFFIDFQGICAWADLDQQFANLFQEEVIREGDCLLITSHLGHNPGLEEICKEFGGEFAVLGVDESDKNAVRGLFRRAHPTMTLFKALSLNGIQSELALRCFGVVKYRDGAPMAIYGYTVSAGRTELAVFVEDSTTSYFDVAKGQVCPAEGF